MWCGGKVGIRNAVGQCHCLAKQQIRNEHHRTCTHVRFGLDVELALGALEFLHGLTVLGVDDLEGELAAFHDDGGWLVQKEICLMFGYAVVCLGRAGELGERRVWSQLISYDRNVNGGGTATKAAGRIAASQRYTRGVESKSRSDELVASYE